MKVNISLVLMKVFLISLMRGAIAGLISTFNAISTRPRDWEVQILFVELVVKETFTIQSIMDRTIVQLSIISCLS
jgi:hypothetical protein